MNENTLFLTATREKYRYKYKGTLTTEDLWDLSLQELDELYLSLKAKVVKEVHPESLMDTVKQADQDTLNAIEIVRFIFIRKSEESKAYARRIRKAGEAQRIMEIIKRKEEAVLEDTDIEALKARLSELTE